MGELVSLSAYRTRRRIARRYPQSGTFSVGKSSVRIALEDVEREWRKIARRERRGDTQLRLV